MRIERIHIRGFGRWVDRVFDFPAGLSVWVGLNETGKTTLVHAILAGLYGLAKRRSNLREIQDRYRPWNANAPFGVTMLLSDGEEQFRLERDFLAETVRSYRKDGRHYLAEEEPDQLLNRLVGINGLNLFRSTLLVTQGEVAAVQEGKLGEAVAAKAVSGEDATTAMSALRWLERELNELIKEGRTDATRSAVQRARTQLTELEGMLSSLEEAGVKEDALLQEIAGLEQEIIEKQTYQDTYVPLVQKYDQFQAAKTAREQGRQRLEDLVQEFNGIERNKRLWEEAQAKLDSFTGHEGVTAEQRKVEESLWLQLQTGQGQEAQQQARRRRLEEEIKGLQMQLSGLSVERTFEERTTREGWMRYRELVEYQRKLKEEIRENTTIGDDAQRRIGNKLMAPAGIVAGFGLILPPLLFKALSFVLFGLLFIPAFVIIGLSIRALVISAQAVQEAERAEAKGRRLQEEADRITGEIDRVLDGRTPEEYRLDLETGEAESRKAVELGGKLAVLREEGNRLQDELRTIVLRLTEWNQQLKSVWYAAGVASHDDYLAQCERYDQISEEERLANVRLVQSLRGKTFADWEMMIAAQTTDCHLLEAGVEELCLAADALEVENHRQRLTAIGEQLPSLIQEKEILKDRLQSLQETYSGTDRHRLAAELAFWREELDDLNRRAEGLKLAKDILSEAWGEVNARLTPVLVERTSELFSRLTQGRYNKLRVPGGSKPRDELNIEIALPEGGWAIAETLSSGARDQLYFALRIALGEYLTGRTDFPLILDDPFIHFDPVRLYQTVQLLKELGSSHQIIWLTKEPRVAQDFPELFIGETT